MNYRQTLEYLYAQLPMFHRIGPAAYKANLDNTHALMEYLGHPQKQFESIHIAGTNGKGSVSHMLASVLQNAGYKTALCTSPHLKDFRERIRINGHMIPQSYVARFVTRHKAFFEQIQPSFFELTIALSFSYFAEQQVDVAVIETGLGGRLDSTNVITPQLAIITNIGMDHTNLLGDTLEKIAWEKAGIIKPGVPIVNGVTRPEARTIIQDRARELQAPFFAAEQEIPLLSHQYISRENIPFLEIVVQQKDLEKSYRSVLTGSYQLQNLLTLLQAVEVLRQGKQFRIDEESLIAGLEQVVDLTGLKGRWQQLGKRPLVICDTGHNVDGIRFILENIARTTHQHLHMVIGMMNDKDVGGILSMLPPDATYYFCKPDVPRGLDVLLLRDTAVGMGMRGEAYGNVKLALQAAKKQASRHDLIFVGGSTFVVAEVV